MPKSSETWNDPGLLEAALEGLLLQKQRIETQIQEVKALLRGKRRTSRKVTLIVPATPAPGATARVSTVKRELSDAARKRIAAAQKKRWAEYRRQRKASGE